MDKIVKQSVDLCIEEFKKEHNQQKLEDNILDPVIQYIGDRLWPYIMYSVIFISLLLLLLLYIIYILQQSNKKSV